MITPEPASSSCLGIALKKRLASAKILQLEDYQYLVTLLGQKCAYIFHQDSAFTTAPVAMADTRYQSARIHFQKGLWLFVGIDLNVLILQSLGLHRDPDALHEWTRKEC